MSEDASGREPTSIERILTIAELRHRLDVARQGGLRVGLVPTMGALHDGHGSLIRAAIADGNDVVVTTIFVNPLQFGAGEDLAAYPRDLDGDRVLAAAAGATHLFTPSVEEMYPDGRDGVLTSVRVAGLTDVLDGAARPGHFDGVATVVTKLFNIAGPCRAYFGEKDFQQLAVIRRMVHDLSFPIDVVGCPTIREANGLARSSRNRYLTDDQRSRAAVVSAALASGVALVESGERSPVAVDAAMREILDAEPVVSSVDYAVCVDPSTLRAPAAITSPVRLLVACRVGKARLIDNCAAVPPTPAST